MTSGRRGAWNGEGLHAAYGRWSGGAGGVCSSRGWRTGQMTRRIPSKRVAVARPAVSLSTMRSSGSPATLLTTRLRQHAHGDPCAFPRIRACVLGKNATLSLCINFASSSEQPRESGPRKRRARGLVFLQESRVRIRRSRRQPLPSSEAFSPPCTQAVRSMSWGRASGASRWHSLLPET